MAIQTYGGKVLAIGSKVSGGGGCCCGPIPCTACDTDTTPSGLDVEFTGFAPNTAFCDCASMDGLYSLAQVSACSWNFTTTGTGCFVRTITATVLLDGANYKLRVAATLRDDIGSDHVITYEVDLGTALPDCAAFAAQVVSYISGSSPRCTPESVTVTVTSVA